MVLEIFGVVFGFIYLYLEIRQEKGMWAVGFLMALVYAAVYWKGQVYASMGFQIYYVLVSVYGFLEWRRQGKSQLQAAGREHGAAQGRGDEAWEQGRRILYRKLPGSVLLWSTVVYAVATASMMGVLGRFTGDPVPFADSSVTVLSAIATFWLSRAYREQWLVWLLVNVVTVVMTLELQLYPTAVLYTVNAVASVYGYIHWKRNGTLLNSRG